MCVLCSPSQGRNFNHHFLFHHLPIVIANTIIPLGPMTTFVINVSRVMRDLVPLLTLLSPQELFQNSAIFDELF